MKAIIRVISYFSYSSKGDTGSSDIIIPIKIKGLWELSYGIDEIPSPIKILYPFISKEGYIKKQEDPMFLY